jgi:hypothetical protein
MKMRLFYFIIHVPFLNVYGMALFPFILVKNKSLKKDKYLINHEKIHLIQQLELLIIPFYILYLINYFINRFRYHDHDAAYRNIFFEREAYQNDDNLDYLKKRPLWNFRKYVFIK